MSANVEHFFTGRRGVKETLLTIQPF